MCVRASASAGPGGWGGGSPLVVHRASGQDAEVAVGDSDRDASVLEPALLRPPRGPARLACCLIPRMHG